MNLRRVLLILVVTVVSIVFMGCPFDFIPMEPYEEEPGLYIGANITAGDNLGKVIIKSDASSQNTGNVDGYDIFDYIGKDVVDADVKFNGIKADYSGEPLKYYIGEFFVKENESVDFSMTWTTFNIKETIKIPKSPSITSGKELVHDLSKDLVITWEKIDPQPNWIEVKTKDTVSGRTYEYWVHQDETSHTIPGGTLGDSVGDNQSVTITIESINSIPLDGEGLYSHSVLEASSAETIYLNRTF